MPAGVASHVREGSEMHAVSFSSVWRFEGVAEVVRREGIEGVRRKLCFCSGVRWAIVG